MQWKSVRVNAQHAQTTKNSYPVCIVAAAANFPPFIIDIFIPLLHRASFRMMRLAFTVLNETRGDSKERVVAKTVRILTDLASKVTEGC